MRKDIGIPRASRVRAQGSAISRLSILELVSLMCSNPRVKRIFAASGAGKGWAKGRSAVTDPRVARNAASHRGKTYRRHVTPDKDRRHHSLDGCVARTLPLTWSDEMAYVVGLLATDGCLSKSGRHLSFDSSDEQLVITFLKCLGRPLRYSRIRTRIGNWSFKAQFGDVAFYGWLRSIGLHPRKSLTLGRIDVPRRYLAPLVRGLLDGDGTISNFVHFPTPSTAPDYLYERLWVYFSSASRPHVEWLRSALRRTFGVSGYIERRPPTEKRREFFRLKYGKFDSILLLKAIYPSTAVPKLERKWKIWNDYAERNALN